MLVLHVYVLGKDGAIERSYDFLRNDGKEDLDGVDVIIPYKDREEFPTVLEKDAMVLIANRDIKGNH